MKKIPISYKILSSILVCFLLVGCATTVPKGFLKASEKSLANRQLQMRQYETKDEQKIITSVAGVLQDLGFTLDNSETGVGFVAASKNADAKSGGQIAGAVLLTILSRGQSDFVSKCDKAQKIRASVITQPSLDGNKIVVRVTFQRIVWSMDNQISRIETINDPKIYEKFYDSLSKAIFLETEKI